MVSSESLVVVAEEDRLSETTKAVDGDDEDEDDDEVSAVPMLSTNTPFLRFWLSSSKKETLRISTLSPNLLRFI